MTKEDYKHKVLSLAFESNNAALNRPAVRVVSDVLSIFYHVLDRESFEKIDQVLRKSFPEYYQQDGRTKINMDHFKMETIQGGQLLRHKTEDEIAAMYAPSQA